MIRINKKQNKRGRRKSNDTPNGSFSFSENLQPMWGGGKPIAPPKLKDLKSLMHLIPNHAKGFYKSLHGDATIVDDLEGFCAPPDFEFDEEL